MHLGQFDDEPATVALMDDYLEQNGYVNDFSETRLHHEIYLSDARTHVAQTFAGRMTFCKAAHIRETHERFQK